MVKNFDIVLTEEWDKLEREQIIQKDRKALIFKIDGIIVVIISTEVLLKFDMDDGFTIGPDGEHMYNISHQNCWGNTIDIVKANRTNSSYLSISSGNKNRLRYSKAMMFKNISIDLLIEQVEELIKEFHHRLEHPFHKNSGRYLKLKNCKSVIPQKIKIHFIY